MTDGDGRAVLRSVDQSLGRLFLRHPDFVNRDTYVKVEGGPLVISVIPKGFDLTAFDEFARPLGQLRRWVSNPRLLVFRQVLDFSTANLFFNEFTVTDQAISDASAACLAAGLSGSVEMMSQAALRFESVEFETAVPNSRIRIDAGPTGTILVFPARQVGANGRGDAFGGSLAGYVTRGVVFIDVNRVAFCAQGAARVFAHELGHALGYSHVTRQASIMGAVTTTDVLTDFDREAISIVYQRLPANTTPDIDPFGRSLNAPSAVAPLQPGLFRHPRQEPPE